MKTILFHCTGGSPDSFWYPYIKENLKQRGYEVSIPAFPNPNAPTLAGSLPVALQENYDEETILIGHSSGATLILSVLESINVRIQQAILVAGFFEPLEKGKPEPMVQETYDWKKIQGNCTSFIFINSDNDPWGCDDTVGRALVDKLGGVFVLPKGQGHMGSTSFNQPYREFPLLLKLVD